MILPNHALFDQFAKAILNYNKKHMLTGFKSQAAIFSNLFVNSLKAFQDIDLSNQKLLDIGTGAGIPGIALKISNPLLDLTLLEASRKRITFLKSLSVVPFTLWAGRAEDLAKTHQEQFDIVTMRAVAPIAIALELACQFVKIGGRVVLIKGPKAPQEITNAAVAALVFGFQLQKQTSFMEANKTTIVVVYQKMKKTNSKFPRPFNLIKKEKITKEDYLWEK